MKCAVLELQQGINQAFIMPFGITIKAGQKLLVKAAQRRGLLTSNTMALKDTKEFVDMPKLKAGSYEITDVAASSGSSPAAVVKKITKKKNKSMSGSTKKRNKKA